MKYNPVELSELLKNANQVILRIDSIDTLKSNEFSSACLDLVIEARKLNLIKVLASEASYNVSIFAERMAIDYFCVLGVVAASPFLPRHEYEKSLESISELLDHPGYFNLINETRIGFNAKSDSIGMNSHSLKKDTYLAFNNIHAGFHLASKYEVLDDVVHAAKAPGVCQQNIEQLSSFLEKLEKTREKSADWDQYVGLFKQIASQIADQSPLGRKNPFISKIQCLVNDGAPIVSVDDCARATDYIFKGLLYDEQSLTDEFQKNLDILDDHDSFYEIAFQSQFFDLSKKQSFFDHGFKSHSAEGREAFSKNLRMLLERMEGRVADPKIVLAGFLFGSSVIDALTLRDRAQGNPRWLEHAILDRTHDPRMLMRPDSSLSVVLNSLLSSADEVERRAFWDSRPERYLGRQSHDSQEFGR